MKLPIFALFVLAATTQAAAIDGHWTAATMVHSKKNPTVKTTTIALDLKTQDGTLTGTVSLQRARKPFTSVISDVKIEGDPSQLMAHFTTAGRKADTKIEWTLALNGDQLKGTLWREGAKHSQSFTANRTN
jgi:hypothetical protein